MTETIIEGWPEPVVTTSDHQFLLTTGEWREAGALHPGDRIAMPVGKLSQAMVKVIPFDKACRLPRRFIGAGGDQSNARLLKAPECISLGPDALFTFGYYVGDGFASTIAGKGRFVSFAGHQEKDASAHARVRAWCENQGMNVHVRYSPGFGMEMRAFSGEWALWFRKTFGTGAFEKHLPEWALTLSESQSRILLAGMVAADGYVRRGRTEYITVSALLASQVARLMLRCGLRPCIGRQSTGAYVIAFSKGLVPYGLVREVKHRFPRKPGGRRERVYDLSVEEEESFVVGLAVVHNCHRIGQRDSVLVQHLVLEGSLDATMARSLVEKQKVIDAALDLERDELAGDPIVPMLEGHATDGLARSRIEREALSLTQAQIDAVGEALRALVGVGPLNRIDEGMIAALAGRVHLTPRQAALGRRIVRKYSDKKGDE